MERNNGKIAIAIVAMFVVALSIVGFTYAYFVANVRGNTNTNVTVTSGELIVQYTNTQAISVTGIAPNWKSDGLHYFDTTTGCVSEGTELRCTAQKAASADEAKDKLGVHSPAKFNVSAAHEDNTGAVNYVVILNGITSTGFADADRDNLTYALCIDSCPATEYAADVKTDYAGLTVNATGTASQTVLSKGTLAPKGQVVQVISGVQTLADGADADYEVMVYYANDATAPQDSKGAVATANIEVVGVQKDTAGNWVDANGVIIIPA